MYRIISGSTHGLRDTEDFIESLDESLEALPQEWRELFDPQQELLVTRAPGRFDLMGGIADYSGSLVLPLPIAGATHCALQLGKHRTIRIASLPANSSEAPRLFQIGLEELFADGSPIAYADARARFRNDAEDHWAAYVIGAFVVLLHEHQLNLQAGANILIRSSVPEGAGVSSSAALEVAVMQAVIKTYESEMPPDQVALLCQKVENLIAGAPCGVMDQMTAVSGRANCLLELLCQPAQLKGMVALPVELAVWGIDSGIHHSIGGESYATVRTAAFMGYRIITECAGLKVRAGAAPGQVEIEDQKWNGYLANVTPEEFATTYGGHFPERISGREFLDRYQGISDPSTSVDPSIEYPLKRATEHPIYENRRVHAFAGTLKQWKGLDQAVQLGEWMRQSHQSYSNCGLGSEATDKLFNLAAEYLDEGIFGARISGGGNGGTVVILGRRGADAAVAEIADRYHSETGNPPMIISGSSNGAHAFGALRLARQTVN